MYREYYNIEGKNLYPQIYNAYFGINKYDSNVTFGPSFAEMYVIHYVISGKGHYLHNNTTYFEVKTGDVFIVKPKEITMHRSDGEEPWTVCWFAFLGDSVEKMLEFMGITDFVIPQKNTIFYDACMECINYYETNEVKSQIMLESYLLKALSGIEKSIKGEVKPDSKWVELAKSYIDVNYSSGITVSDIANFIGINRSHFYRLFKTREGISPQEYINNLRMKKAKEFIKNNIPFKEIAPMVGLSDVYHFSKFFKSKFGITPSEYRERYMQKKTTKD